MVAVDTHPLWLRPEPRQHWSYFSCSYLGIWLELVSKSTSIYWAFLGFRPWLYMGGTKMSKTGFVPQRRTLWGARPCPWVHIECNLGQKPGLKAGVDFPTFVGDLNKQYLCSLPEVYANWEIEQSTVGIHIVAINGHQLTGNKKRLLIQSLLCKGVSHQHLPLGRDSETGGGVGKLRSGKRRRLQVRPDWKELS